MRKMKVIINLLIVIALAGLPAGVQAEGADDGLVAEWCFDEGSGSVLKDSSGNGNDGMIYGATWVEGMYGNALSFGGVDDYVGMSTSSILNPDDGSWTVEAWINIPTHPRSDHIYPVMAKHDGDMDNGYSLHISGNTKTVNYMVDHYKGPVYKANSAISINTWYHVVGVLDRTTNTLKIIVNGFQTGSTPISELGTINPSNTLWIGRYNRDGRSRFEYFNGIIDEVRIYNRALTADEIKEHYEGKLTTLSLIKSASPHSIKQGQTTTITLAVENTGTIEITNIEVSDTIPLDLILVSGEISKTYTSLRPKDSREFQYVLQLNEAGTFNLNPATATYADEEGNYHTAESETAAITVIPSIDQSVTPQITKNPSTEISTASVHLHGEKTNVVMGEDILLKLSAVNKITKPTITLQVILIPPSGMSVTSADFVESGAGLYTSTYVIEPGVGRDIEVGIRSNQVGDFVVNGEVIYYFGDDKENAEEHILSLPITVRANPMHTPTSTPTPEPSHGFGSAFAAVGLLFVALLLKRRRVG